MHDYIGKLAIINNSITDPSKIADLTFSEKSVYEVIRVINKIPLFIEDHLSRLYESIKILDFSFNEDWEYIINHISSLISLNDLENGNIKIVISLKKKQILFLTYIIKHSYPPPSLYKTGISTSVLFAERKNPNAKNFQPVSDLAKRMIIERSVYEVILVTQNKQITEGSKSNLFFIKGNTLITAKAESVLKGITRKYVLKAAENINMHIDERDIYLPEVTEFDAAFISGTSPKVLPIKNIDQYEFNINTNLNNLIEEYNAILNNYILSKKSI